MGSTQEYLKILCDAFYGDHIDRRTFIRERRRLIEEAIAGVPSAPPAIPDDFDPDATLINLDSTVRLPRRPPAADA